MIYTLSNRSAKDETRIGQISGPIFPENPIPIFIHGSGQNTTTVLEKVSIFSKLYNFENIISLDWPTGDSTGNYEDTREIAKTSGIKFAKYMKIWLYDQPDHSIMIFAHSMGNEVLWNFLSGLNYLCLRKFNKIIFNAADIPQDIFPTLCGMLKAQGVKSIAIINRNDRILSYASGQSSWLKNVISSIALGGTKKYQRLGNSKIGNTEYSIDLTKYVGNKHEYYLGHPKETIEIYKTLFNSN